MSKDINGPRFEAALNVLREQARAVDAVRRQLQDDRELLAEDPAHHRHLMVQTRKETVQLRDAVDVLTRVAEGAAVGWSPSGRACREIGVATEHGAHA